MRSKARKLYGLHAALTLAALALVLAATVVATSATTLTLPSASSLIKSCGAWLTLLSNPVHIAILTGYGLGAAAVFRGGRAAWRIRRDTRQVLGRLQVVGMLPESPVAMVFTDPAPRAFCTGLRRPRIYLSTGAVDRLSDSARRAVVAHEAEHAARRDPLRLFAGLITTEACFFVPGIEQLRRRCEALAELAADQAAIDECGGAAPLAAAIVSLGDPAQDGFLVGATNERVEHLLGNGGHSVVPRTALASASIAIAVLSVVVMGFAHASPGTRLPLATLAMQACNPVMFAAAGLLTASALRRRRRASPSSRRAFQ